MKSLPEGIPSEVDAAFRKALRYRRRDYVTGVAVGEAVRGGSPIENELAICIHVREKYTKSKLTRRQIFPTEIDGVPVDVCERVHRPCYLSDEERLLRQLEPAATALPGMQIGVDGGGSGTLGMVVYERSSGEACILGSAHVMGNNGTVVYQPSRRNANSPIGTVVRSRLTNSCDAAFARLDQMRPVGPVPLGLDTPITSIRRVVLNEVLVKSGAETGVTKGRVSQYGVFDILYPDRTRPMEGFEIRPVDPGDEAEITVEGDSGAIWYDPGSGAGVGITTAGDRDSNFNPDEWVFCCDLNVVFRELPISLVAAG